MVKTFNKIVNGIYILIIILLVLYIGLRYTNKIEIYSVETGSMESNIHKGDYILIYKGGKYKIGDVITFRENDYFVTHRIIDISNDGITTKGDANNTEDTKIDKTDIVGKVILVGGILNIVINFKFSIVAVLFAIYLLTCYFGYGKNNENNVNKQKDISTKKEVK